MNQTHSQSIFQKTKSMDAQTMISNFLNSLSVSFVHSISIRGKVIAAVQSPTNEMIAAIIVIVIFLFGLRIFDCFLDFAKGCGTIFAAVVFLSLSLCLFFFLVLFDFWLCVLGVELSSNDRKGGKIMIQEFIHSVGYKYCS